MAGGLQKASLSVYHRGQMSGFAVEEQTQPHLINNIIVLLHTAIKTHPPPSFSFLSFFLFQALAACCPVAWLSQSDTATIHRNKTRVKSQKVKTNSTAASYQTEDIKISWDTLKNHTVYSNTMRIICTVIFVQLWNICNLNSEQIISMSATSEAPGGKIYSHLCFKKDIRV